MGRGVMDYTTGEILADYYEGIERGEWLEAEERRKENELNWKQSEENL